MGRPTRYVVALAWLLGWASSGLAQDASHRAESLVTEGIALRRQGKDAAALTRFQEAAALHPSPRTKAQVALAEQALGRWLAAEAHLAEALRHSEDAWVTQNRAVLERSLQRIGEHLGSVELSGALPLRTEVRVNGKLVGTTPLPGPIRVLAGTVVIRLSAEGYHFVQRTIQIGAGQVHREKVRLVASEAAQPKPASAPACPPGQARSKATEGKCCWPGQRWSANHGACRGTPTCPSGMRPVAEDCKHPETKPTPPHTLMTSDTEKEPVAYNEGALPSPATGFEGGLFLTLGADFDNRAALFLRQELPGEQAYGPRLGGGLSLGYRPLRFLSVGLLFDAGYASGDGVAASTTAISLGGYLRGHILGRRHAGAVDAWLGGAFMPLASLWVVPEQGPESQLSAFAVALQLGLGLFATKAVGFELRLGATSWLPLEYCIEGLDMDACTDNLVPEWRWELGLGMQWLI